LPGVRFTSEQLTKATTATKKLIIKYFFIMYILISLLNSLSSFIYIERAKALASTSKLWP
jgi:hypothetical protein